MDQILYRFERTKISFLVLIVFSLSPSIAFASTGIQSKSSACKSNQVLPDPVCTTGTVFQVATSTLCTVGYTTKVRDVPLSVKKQVFKNYGIDYSLHANYEVDHLISLELGGSNDISNLWPESYIISNGSHAKDGFENYLHNQVCKGSISLTEAQKEISTNWLYYDNLWRGVKTMTATTTDTAPAVKKSTSGICHAKGTTYTTTKMFTPFATLAACLGSGGRLPK